jgi:CRP-like cAMP-binding protein
MTSMEAINDLYGGVSEQVRTELAHFEKTQKAPRGTKLVEAGVRPDHLAILDSGRAETCVQVRGKITSLGTMGPGRVFGLHSILSGEVPQTTVTCLEDCVVTLVPREAFKLVLERHPGMYLAVAKVLSADLATADHLLRQNALTVRTKPGRKSSK